MPGYTPLFSEIVTSSIWNEDNSVRIVWITLMALADMDGNVMASIAGLAPVARVSLRDCKKAIDVLSSPDEYSRSQELQGRRITPIEGGWHLVNHRKYRQKAKSRAEYFRNYRERKKKETNSNTNPKAYSNSETQCNTAQQSATVAKFTENQCIDTGWMIGIPEEQCKEFFHHYNSQGWKKGNGQEITNLKSMMVKWKNNQYRFEKSNKESFEEKLAKAGKKAQDGKL